MKRIHHHHEIIVLIGICIISIQCHCSPPCVSTSPDSPTEDNSVVLDGMFSEWSEHTLLATDPVGDAVGGFDLSRVHAVSRGSTLYLAYDTGRTLNMQSGPGSEGTLVIELTLPDDHVLTVDMRKRKVFVTGGEKRILSWSDIDYINTPTYAHDRFELRINLVGLNVRTGDTIDLQFSGSDSLDQPVPVTLADPPAVIKRRTPARMSGTDFRLASLNTLKDGLVDPARRDRMVRYLRAVNANIYCFQEEWDLDDPKDITASIMQEDSGGGQSHHNHDCMIATRHELIPVPAETGPFAAAVVIIRAEPILVISLHTKCCGYIGSPEDLQRIEQVKAVIHTIKRFREGQYGMQLEPYRHAAVIVVGDFNLVGSRTPVDLLTDRPADLKQWLLPNLIGQTTYTWRDDPSTFSPGALDIAVYSPDRLTPRNGFVLDTAQLNDTELGHLGLTGDESLVSDHLLMVMDFSLK